MSIRLLTVNLTSKLLKAFPDYEDMTYDSPTILRWDVRFGNARVILKMKHCWVFKKHKTKDQWLQVYRCRYDQLQHVEDQIIKMVRKINA